MSEPADIVARILSAGGAIHPDIAPKGHAAGLVVVGVPDDLWKIYHVALAEYFKEHPTAPALETSRTVLWARTQAFLEEKWTAAGRPDFIQESLERDRVLDPAWQLLDEIWLANRQGQRLEEFPRALRKFRAAMLTHLGKTAP